MGKIQKILFSFKNGIDFRKKENTKKIFKVL